MTPAGALPECTGDADPPCVCTARVRQRGGQRLLPAAWQRREPTRGHAIRGGRPVRGHPHQGWLARSQHDQGAGVLPGHGRPSRAGRAGGTDHQPDPRARDLSLPRRAGARVESDAARQDLHRDRAAREAHATGGDRHHEARALRRRHLVVCSPGQRSSTGCNVRSAPAWLPRPRCRATSSSSARPRAPPSASSSPNGCWGRSAGSRRRRTRCRSSSPTSRSRHSVRRRPRS